MRKEIPFKWQWKESKDGYTYSDKIDYKTKTVTQDKEGNYIIIKG